MQSYNTGYDNIAVSAYEFIQLLEHIPYMAYWKDIQKQKFLGCNQKFAKFIGLDDPAKIIGLSGYDFAPETFVTLVRNYEAKAITAKQSISIKEEIFHEITGQTLMEATFVPILNNCNDVTSIVGYGTTIAMLAGKMWHQAINAIQKENIKKLIKLSKYPVKSAHGIVTLTKKEAVCALFLLKGLKSKEIANEMELAHRTVDNHIENMKSKLHCTSRSQLAAILINGEFIDNFC